MHQIRHSGLEKVDANLDFEGRLHLHIQMSTGKHKEIVHRVQALEDLVMHQNRRDTEGRAEVNPTSNAHDQEIPGILKSLPRKEANQKGHRTKQRTTKRTT